MTAADAGAGKDLYLRECSGCHGERGNGKGPAAAFVDPRPRDFTLGDFKFRTTPSGKPPATGDILRIIERGIPGTAMPSFAFLPEKERKQIAAYVLKLADLLDEPEPKPVGVPGQPPAATPAQLEKGKQLYADAGCASCHGDLGKGDGPAAKDLKDAQGNPIQARDLTQGIFRGGGDRVDVYYRLVTGLNGTPMPSYADSLEAPDLWALTDYVLSLRVPAPAKPRPDDPIAAGREVAAKYSCGGCHVLDDGRGGDVGPDLRLSAQKLHPDWVRAFLKAPRDYGKIYPWRVYRMPKLALSDDEVQVLTRYLAAVGKRKEGPIALPDPSKFPADKVGEGKLVYMLRCTECHNLGSVIEIPVVKQQGPDLIRVATRVDYQWAGSWIQNPKQVDPTTRMVVPDITAEQAEAVRMFVWKTSMEAGQPGKMARNDAPARGQ
ncbi:MAG TPA: c-type cytochrome [Gemmatimonadales bacterium]|nr:c-type cytochrome [Gemmatimonadales bacterium]